MNAILEQIKPTVLIALSFGLIVVVWAFAIGLEGADNLGSMYIGIISGLSSNLTKKKG